MEATPIRVSHDGLDRAADGLHAACRRIDERLDRLESELAPLRSDWTGEAQHAYELARARWEQAMREPNVRGLIPGRALLYPADGDVEGIVGTAARIVHGNATGSDGGGA